MYIPNSIRKAMLITGVISLSLNSCKEDFLTVLPTGSLAEAQLATKDGVEGLLIGAYAALNGKTNGNRLAGPNNWVTGAICGGDANKGTDPGDYSSINPIQRYETNPTSGDIEAVWQARYEGVSRCNATLTMLKTAGAKITADDTKRITAEARFLRGHYYFELKKLFNSIPWFDESVADRSTVKNSAAVWDKIEADLKHAYDNLPETSSAAGRVNKWAAGAYLAKAYLFQKKYAEAKALFDTVIANGKTTNGKKYGLFPDYGEMFNATNDNHEESVFAVQSANNTGSTNNSNFFDDLNYPYNTGANGPGNCCGFFQPSFDFVNAHRTDANGLPLLDGSYNSATNAVKHDYGVSSDAAFTPDAGNLDPRLDHTVGRRGIPYLGWQDHPGAAWIRSQPYAGPYSPKKYVYRKGQDNTLTDGSSWTRGYAVMNYMIIRFADVLLMAAECEVEVGSLEKAREYVNMIRTRAANSMIMKGGAPAANYVIKTYSTAWTDKAVARNAVKFERRIELGNEGHRFFDLVRWGDASAVLNAYLANEAKVLTTKYGGAKFTAGKNEYFPIPQNQIDITGKDILAQNPGY